MSYNPNRQDQDWATCRARLMEVIAKWQKRYRAEGVQIDCPAAPRYTSLFADKAARAVSVTFTAGKHVNRTITIDRFERPVDNLCALAIGLDAIRLNGLRGLAAVARQGYVALPPARERDPWEVLGLRRDADMDTIDAVYRAKAKRLHPDVGGSSEAFQELQEAYEAVKKL